MHCPIAISTLRCANLLSLLVSASLQTATSSTITSVSLFVSPLLSTQLVWKYACPVARDHTQDHGYHYEHSHQYQQALHGRRPLLVLLEWVCFFCLVTHCVSGLLCGVHCAVLDLLQCALDVWHLYLW